MTILFRVGARRIESVTVQTGGVERKEEAEQDWIVLVRVPFRGEEEEAGVGTGRGVAIEIGGPRGETGGATGDPGDPPPAPGRTVAKDDPGAWGHIVS